MKLLDAQMAKLLKPRSPVAQINNLKSRLFQVEKDMNAAKGAARGISDGRSRSRHT